MRLAIGAWWMLLASVAWPVYASAQAAGSNAAAAPPASAPASPVSSSTWQPDDRLLLSADGATLTGTKGGEGGSAGYLYEPSADALLGAAVEYQRLADAYWTFGSLNAAFSHALTSTTRWDVHADAHQGYGDSGGHSFDYSIAAAGVGFTLPGGVAIDGEERHFDVDTTRGNLPKLTLSKVWGTHWLATVAYAQSYGGNLDTNYSLVRLDYYGRGFSLLGGASIGRVTPAVVNLVGVLQPQAEHLSEPFLGVTKSIKRVDLTLLGDDFNLAGIRHFTLTLNCVVHFK